MKSRTRLSDFPFTFHFHALEKEMVPHSSVLAWRIPGTGGPGGLLSMGLHRVGHDWGDLAAAAMMPFEKQSFFKKNLMMSSVSCFLLLLMLLVSYLRNHCLIQHHKDLFLCFLLRVFYFSSYIYVYDQFGVSLMYCIRKEFKFILLPVNIQLSPT